MPCTNAFCSSSSRTLAGRRTLETQRLLIPEQVELTAEQAARTLEHAAQLAELGLGVEDFGGGTVLVTSYPTLLGRRPAAEILRGVVDHLMSKGRLPTREQFLSEIMSLMACHAAVRSGDPLTAGGDRRPHGHAPFRPGHAPLPARPAHGAVVHPPGSRPAISAHVTALKRASLHPDFE